MHTNNQFDYNEYFLMRMLLWSCYGLKSLESVNYVKNKYIEYINIVTCRGLHVTGVIRFVPELLL